MKKFEVGNIYVMLFIGDSELRPQWICIKRTAKTATFKRCNDQELITRKIKSYDNTEFVMYGSYSMAPSINAKRIIG